MVSVQLESEGQMVCKGGWSLGHLVSPLTNRGDLTGDCPHYLM